LEWATKLLLAYTLKLSGLEKQFTIHGIYNVAYRACYRINIFLGAGVMARKVFLPSFHGERESAQSVMFGALEAETISP
jgi:hypothetical protein